MALLLGLLIIATLAVQALHNKRQPKVGTPIRGIDTNQISAFAAQADLDLRRISSSIEALVAERDKQSESHRQAQLDLGAVIINLMILLKTNEVEVPRVAFATNWNLSMTWGATNTNRMFIKYTE